MLNRRTIEKGIAELVQVHEDRIAAASISNHQRSEDARQAFVGAVRLFLAMARADGVAKGYGWTRHQGSVLDVVTLRASARITLAAMKNFEQQPFYFSCPEKLR